MHIKSTLEDIFKDFVDAADLKKKPPEVVEFNDDPVALSCASYEIYLKNPGARWFDIRRVEATEEDRLKAQEIRRYYRDRIMMQSLTASYPQSEFRQKLYGIVMGERPVYDDELGILYRLPYFYAEDTAIDRAIEKTNPTIVSEEGFVGSLFGSDVVGEYRLLERVLKGRRRGTETVQLWLESISTPHLYLIAVQSSNPLLPLLESVLARPTQLKAHGYIKEHRGFHSGKQYMQLGSIELA